MEVSVRELKNNLSMYLRRVQAGEALTITSHRKIVGFLTPAQPSTGAVEARLATAPGIRWSGGKPAADTHAPKAKKGRTVSSLVLEDRGPR